MRTPRWRAILWPSKVKFTSSTPWRSAHAPNSASAPAAPPLNRIASSAFISAIIASAMDSSVRRYRAGESLEDYCRACKTDRMHTVIVIDADGRPMRVSCGYCHSEHNYRGGGRIGLEGGASTSARRAPADQPKRGSDKEPFPIVSDRERTAPPMTPDRDVDHELLL